MSALFASLVAKLLPWLVAAGAAPFPGGAPEGEEP
jgi:hypothetical protein